MQSLLLQAKKMQVSARTTHDPYAVMGLRDNAVSALGKMLLVGPQLLKLTDVIPLYLNSLPLLGLLSVIVPLSLTRSYSTNSRTKRQMISKRRSSCTRASSRWSMCFRKSTLVSSNRFCHKLSKFSLKCSQGGAGEGQDLCAGLCFAIAASLVVGRLWLCDVWFEISLILLFECVAVGVHAAQGEGRRQVAQVLNLI